MHGIWSTSRFQNKQVQTSALFQSVRASIRNGCNTDAARLNEDTRFCLFFSKLHKVGDDIWGESISRRIRESVIRTAGPGVPAAPVSPSLPGRP